jgi:hypothetical protein
MPSSPRHRDRQILDRKLHQLNVSRSKSLTICCLASLEWAYPQEPPQTTVEPAIRDDLGERLRSEVSHQVTRQAMSRVGRLVQDWTDGGWLPDRATERTSPLDLSMSSASCAGHRSIYFWHRGSPESNLDGVASPIRDPLPLRCPYVAHSIFREKALPRMPRGA